MTSGKHTRLHVYLTADASQWQEHPVNEAETHCVNNMDSSRSSLRLQNRCTVINSW